MEIYLVFQHSLFMLGCSLVIYLHRFQDIGAATVSEAVQRIIPFLEDTSEPNQVIYFDGWRGLGASAVIASVAEEPPQNLRNKFDEIIHIDCSRWRNRRALQRTIGRKLMLPQHIMAILDRHDEEDDFSGVDEGSRVEIRDVGREIHRSLQGRRCLVVFQNGSNTTVDMNDFGIPQPSDPWSDVLKILWTFRGRVRSIPGILKRRADQIHDNPSSESERTDNRVPQTDRVDNSHIYLYSDVDDSESAAWNELVREEATELAQYTHKFGITLEEAALCCKYMLLLNSKGSNILDYNWATQASNYWVCDGIILECQQDKAWKAGTALLEEMGLEDFSSYRLPDFGDKTRWIVATNSDTEEIKPETTSFFWANKWGGVASLPTDTFRKSDQLRVLKLCLCSFSFSSPPFLHCRNIRFLGLDKCKDQRNEQDRDRREDEKDMRKTEFFRSLWVLDICFTDWELNVFPNIKERMTVEMREISIKSGRIWHKNHPWTWRHLPNIHKLRVIEPTCPWETGSMDDFGDMVKLELLDLSGNRTIKVLPSLSGSTALSNLVLLDGCIGLEHIGPEGLPPLIETFSLDAGSGKGHDKEAKISRISMAGCARLVNFRLRGSLPNLEELDLSNTSVKTLDLKDETVQVPCLQRVILLGCERLRAILWPKNGLPKIMVVRIDTRGGTETAQSKTPRDSLASNEIKEYGLRASVSVTDMRFLQSLMLSSANKFFWNTARFTLNICLSCTSKDDAHSNKEMSPQHKSSIRKTQCIYSDFNFDKATVNNDGSRIRQIQPGDLHVEIGEGMNNANVVTEKGIRAVIFLKNQVKSLLVHDNSFITTVIPESMMSIGKENGKRTISWSSLKCCHIERFSKLDTVFATNFDIICFQELETFSATDLLMSRCIWSKGRVGSDVDDKSFAKLQVIHLQFFPRLTFVLPLSWNYIISSLETLHIAYCGDLSQVFPVEAEFLSKLSIGHRGGVLEFPKLKHMYLHELPMLHQICEANMFAPKLETIWVRGCWSLNRLPATNALQDHRPVVDCEKDSRTAPLQVLQEEEPAQTHSSPLRPGDLMMY